MDFDIIPHKELLDWKEIGLGAFGRVYKATYLGIEVAVKEILPSDKYDVSKYFEREWSLMRAARHPNVVLYLGISRGPPPDNYTYIVSEFVENGTLRSYIQDPTCLLPWRLRISFATDITRAMAYLHARNCIHRDLKPDNLLITSNGRVKVGDFGFARIVADLDLVNKRPLTFCGSDAYMSPEIQLGQEFGMETDVYSLGIIFCELLSHNIADGKETFMRAEPTFGINHDEVKERASAGCPREFIALALDCCHDDRLRRPTMPEILLRLASIEATVIQRSSEDESHVGSVKFLRTHGRSGKTGAGRRLPSFGVGVNASRKKDDAESVDLGSEDEEDELTTLTLNGLNLDTGSWKASGWHTSVATSPQGTHIEPDDDSRVPLQPESSEFSTQQSDTNISTTSSTLTVRPPSGSAVRDGLPPHHTREPNNPPSPESRFTDASYFTARASSELGLAMTQDRDTAFPNGIPPRLHRFSLVKLGAKKQPLSSFGGQGNAGNPVTGWGPLDLLFPSGLGVVGVKCDICAKRLGWKPVLECDDCSLRVHLKCGETAPMDCRAGKTQALGG